MECFRQIVRFIKSPFQRNKHRVLEIGPPTNFRKEEPPMFLWDDESGSTLDKYGVIKAAECQSSTRDKIRQHVRRLSVKAMQPLPDHE